MNLNLDTKFLHCNNQSCNKYKSFHLVLYLKLFLRMIRIYQRGIGRKSVKQPVYLAIIS